MYLTVAEKIETWLLTSKIQIADGEQLGAVAGWLTQSGQPAFAYMEITGYYLTCMAFVNQADPLASSAAEERIASSLGWLTRSSQGNTIPPTRQYLACDEEDWRNLAVFSFDIAMVVRGISHTLSHHLSPLSYPLLERYVAYLVELCDSNGHLLPFRLRDGWTGQLLPDTWSTQEGIHQLKIAAAILSIPPVLTPVRLSQVAERLYSRWADCPWEEVRATPFHPMFYFLEGLLFHSICGYHPEGLGKAVSLYERIMALQDLSGYLPAGPGKGPESSRSDVIAQALRIGSVLRRLGYLNGAGWDAKLRGLANALLDFVNAEGAVSQYPIRAPYVPCWNAWCSMFAYQALLLYAATVGQKQLPDGQTLFGLLV